MIPLSIGNVVIVYTAALVLGLFFVWLVGCLARGSRERRSRRNCTQCMFCGAIYEAAASESLPACPQCARPNERTPPPAV